VFFFFIMGKFFIVDENNTINQFITKKLTLYAYNDTRNFYINILISVNLMIIIFCIIIIAIIIYKCFNIYKYNPKYDFRKKVN